MALRSLSQRAASRTQEAFRPKTRQAYTKMFRVFLAFCVYMQVAMVEIDVNVILSFCECLVVNCCSVSMIANYLSAVKANFVLYNMSYSLLDHPRIKYFQKSMRINRPLAVTSQGFFSFYSVTNNDVFAISTLTTATTTSTTTTSHTET